MCTVECDVGYSLDSAHNTITCQKNGVWTGTLPKCISDLFTNLNILEKKLMYFEINNNLVPIFSTSEIG